MSPTWPDQQIQFHPTIRPSMGLVMPVLLNLRCKGIHDGLPPRHLSDSSTVLSSGSPTVLPTGPNWSNWSVRRALDWRSSRVLHQPVRTHHGARRAEHVQTCKAESRAFVAVANSCYLPRQLLTQFDRSMITLWSDTTSWTAMRSGADSALVCAAPQGVRRLAVRKVEGSTTRRMSPPTIAIHEQPPEAGSSRALLDPGGCRGISGLGSADGEQLSARRAAAEAIRSGWPFADLAAGNDHHLGQQRTPQAGRFFRVFLTALDNIGAELLHSEP